MKPLPIVRTLRPNAGAQAEFLKSTERYPAMFGGQGSGKTWAGAAWLIRDHVNYPGTDSLGIEPTFPNVLEIMLPMLEERLQELGIPYVVKRTSPMWITTPTLGSKIRLHSGLNADRITGFEVGRTWIDEPARMPEFTEPKRNVWIAAVGRTRHPRVPDECRRIAVTGTHEGVGTWCHRKWEGDPLPGFKVFRARTSDNPDAAAQEALYLAEYGPELARQYIYGFAVDDMLAALSYATIEGLQDSRCSMRGPDDLEGIPGPLYVGVDIGRRQSLTVYWISRLIDTRLPLLHTEAVVILRNAPFAQQFDTLSRICRLPGFRKCAIDDTYNPETAERAVETFGDRAIERVRFTQQTKLALFQGWVAACQDGMLRIPVDQETVADFYSVKRVIKPGGVVTYCAAMTQDGHADRACGAALSIWAARGAIGGEMVYEAGPALVSSTMRGW